MNHRSSILSLLVLICALPALQLRAQSVSSLQRQAEKNLEQGNYAEAAAQFERAGRISNSDPALLYQAAEAYNRIRDYLNASSAYRAAREDVRFPFAGLRYARALKQAGRYEEAREAFRKSLENYRGDHREVILNVVLNEIAGCDLAISWKEKKDTLPPSSMIRWIGPPLATAENEFAPLPFSDTLLYFSQANPKQAVLMRSTRRDDVWQSPKEAFGLPVSAARGFLCGSFSPDGRRFYFARSDGSPSSARGGSLPKTRSALFVIRRRDSGDWGEPESLRSYINLEGSSNCWPFVCEIGTDEYLFFASDRPGGMGGFDLYSCKRPLLSDDLDFSFPANLGQKINSGSDETTPFYDVFSTTLWFSSMGHASFGGLDVQFSYGAGTQWTQPENAGLPVNSPADDFYFILKKDGNGAFLVSNRNVGPEKDNTTNDDLFELNFTPPN